MSEQKCEQKLRSKQDQVCGRPSQHQTEDGPRCAAHTMIETESVPVGNDHTQMHAPPPTRIKAIEYRFT
jgi:hypothetical protein